MDIKKIYKIRQFIYSGWHNVDSLGRMPERGLTFNPGFNSGTKLVPLPDSSLKLVRMPEGRLTLDPGLALWIKAQTLVLLQGRISGGLAPKVSVL